MTAETTTSSTSDAPALDYSQRDRAIAVNSYTTILRRDTLGHEVFVAYWRDVHGPLCARVPGMDWYVQHHFTHQHDDHLWPLPEGLGPVPGYVLDGAVEIGFASQEHQELFQKTSPVLFSDEQNVFDETVAYTLPSGSTTLVDRQVDAVPNGRDVLDRLHVHFSARPGADLAGWVTSRLAPALVADPGVVKVRVHAPVTYDNAEPAPPAPAVRHTVAAERTSLVILEVGFTDSLARRRFHTSQTYADLQAGLAENAQHVTTFAVTGVYTFLRDGRLTTAGVRGSRVAELIDALGSINHTQDPVRHLMLTNTLLDPA